MKKYRLRKIRNKKEKRQKDRKVIIKTQRHKDKERDQECVC